MATIDNLDIQISASATKASNAIDLLVDKLDVLSKSFNKMDTKGLQKFTGAVKILSDGMQGLKDVKLPDYTRLVKGIKKIEDLDGGKLSEVSRSLSPLASGIKILSNTNFDNKNLQSFINSITNLAKVDVSALANVDFTQLGQSIYSFANILASAPKIQQSVVSMTNAVANLAKTGNNVPIVASYLGQLGTALLKFMTTMSSAPQVSVMTLQFTQAIGNLANVGAKAQVTATNLNFLATELKKVMQILATAPNVSANVIQMTTALAALAAQGRNVGTATNSMSGMLDKYSHSADKATKKTKSLASIFGTLYANFFWVVRGIKGLYKSIESTADYIEAFNYYNVAFDKVAADWSQDYEKYGYENAEAYADSFTDRMDETFKKLSGVQVEIDAEGKGLLSETGLKNLGLNIQEVTQFAAQLASVTNSVGLTGEASLAAANSFTRLAGDISSLFNVDYSDAAQNLQSGLIGQSRALYKYGIDITNATLQTYAYNLGLSKTVKEMTQAEKMQLRMLAILDQSRVSWGDLARTIESPSNQIRMLKNNLSELSQVFGQLFMPILGKILPVLNAVTIALKRLISSIAGFFGIKIDLENSGQALNDIDTGVEDVSDSLDGVAESAKKAKAGLRGFDELKTINMPETSGADGGAGGIVDLTDEILAATAEYNKVFDAWYEQMEQKAEAIADKIEEFMKPIKDMFENISLGNYRQAGEDFSTFISNIFNGLADAINKVDWEQVGKNIGEFLAGFDEAEVIDAVSKFVKAVKDALIKIWTASFKEAPFMTLLLTGIFGGKLLLKNPIIQGVGKAIAEQLYKAIGAKILGNKISQSLVNGMSTNLLTGSTTGGLFAKFQAFGGSLGGQIAIGLITFLAAYNLSKAVYEAITGKELPLTGIETFVGFVRESFASLKNFAGDVWNTVVGIISSIITSVWDFATNITDTAQKLADAISLNNNEIKENFSKFLTGIILFVRAVIKGDWKTAINELVFVWKSGWETIGSALKKPINVIIGGLNFLVDSIESSINSVFKLLNSVQFTVPTWVPPPYGGKTLKFNLKLIDLPSIPYFYNGGFPENASLFWSGEGGVPELVGTVGGNTAVASGAEITGIADAVYSTGQTEAGLLQTAVGLLQVIAEKEYGISPDAIFKSVQKSARTYSARTGRAAFSY